MAKPNDIEGTTPKPVARSDKTAPGRKSGHALQQAGYQKAEEQRAETTTYPADRAVRRQPGRTTRGE
jgi:hypothetical protein